MRCPILVFIKFRGPQALDDNLGARTAILRDRKARNILANWYREWYHGWWAIFFPVSRRVGSDFGESSRAANGRPSRDELDQGSPQSFKSTDSIIQNQRSQFTKRGALVLTLCKLKVCRRRAMFSKTTPRRSFPSIETRRKSPKGRRACR